VFAIIHGRGGARGSPSVSPDVGTQGVIDG